MEASNRDYQGAVISWRHLKLRSWSLFTIHEQSVVAYEDVAWLHEDNHTAIPPGAGSLAKTLRMLGGC